MGQRQFAVAGVGNGLGFVAGAAEDVRNARPPKRPGKSPVVI